MKPFPLMPILIRADLAFKAGSFDRARFYNLLLSAAFRIVNRPDYPQSFDPLLF